MAKPPSDLVLDALNQEVVLLDDRGVIQSYNEAWSDFGRTNNLPPNRKWIGTNYLDYCKGPDGGDQAREGIEELLSGRRDLFQLVYPCHGPNIKRWFEMTATRARRAGATWVVIVHDDVTSRIEADNLRRLLWRESTTNEVNRQTAAALRDFVNEAAHEINTPLTALKIEMESALQGLSGAPPRRIRSALGRLERSASHVGTIGAALSARPSIATVHTKKLGDPLERLRPEADRREIRLETDVEDAFVEADSALLSECVTCLATACLAQCPRGGLVKCVGDTRGERFVLAVQGTSRGAIHASEADLWTLCARELARKAGVTLRETRRGASTLAYEVDAPLADPWTPSEGSKAFTGEAP